MVGPEDLCLGKNSLMFIGETGGLDILLNQGSAAAGKYYHSYLFYLISVVRPQLLILS